MLIFSERCNSVQCRIPGKGCENILISYDVITATTSENSMVGLNWFCGETCMKRLTSKWFSKITIHIHMYTVFCANTLFLLIGRKVIMWLNLASLYHFNESEMSKLKFWHIRLVTPDTQCAPENAKCPVQMTVSEYFLMHFSLKFQYAALHTRYLILTPYVNNAL